MKISDRFAASNTLLTYLGFALGFLIVPTLNVLTAVPVQEVTYSSFLKAPRELQVRWMMRQTEHGPPIRRALVGSSIVGQGFALEDERQISRFWLPGMSVDQAAEMTQNLLAREVPPKTIIVDWAALGETSRYDLRPDRNLPGYSIEVLAFQLEYLLGSNSLEPGKGGGPWQANPTPRAFREMSRNYRRNAINRVSNTQFERFLEVVESECSNRDVSITIARFPLYLSEENYAAFAPLIDARKDNALRTRLQQSTCNFQFVDLFEEGLKRYERLGPAANSKNDWRNANHFNAGFGAAILKDPRFGGTGERLSR